MDKETAKRAKLLQKNVKKLLKVVNCNFDVEIDKNDDYPCVIVDHQVHIAEAVDSDFNYYLYHIVSYSGGYMDPPEEDYVPVGGNDGYFMTLEEAIAIVCESVIMERLHAFAEHIREEIDAKYIEEEEKRLGRLK